MYLPKESLPAADQFLRGNLWPLIERALRQRCPQHPIPEDNATTQSAKAFMRQGYEKCIDDIRSMAYQQLETQEPVVPPSLTDPRD